MKNSIPENMKLTREQIQTAKGEHGNLDLIDAVLPMIATIDGKDLFFFYDADDPKKCFAVQCPTGTFEAWKNQINKKAA